MGEINKRIESGRLDHILRGWGHYTKQEIRRLVAQQRVTVNGQVCDIALFALTKSVFSLSHTSPL